MPHTLVAFTAQLCYTFVVVWHMLRAHNSVYGVGNVMAWYMVLPFHMQLLGSHTARLLAADVAC